MQKINENIFKWVRRSPATTCASLHFIASIFVLFALVFWWWSQGITLRIWPTVFLCEALWMEAFVKTLHRLRNDWCLKRENEVSSGAFRKRHFHDVLREHLTVSSVGMLRPPSGAARRRASWGARLRCEADREWLCLHAILLLCVFFFLFALQRSELWRRRDRTLWLLWLIYDDAFLPCSPFFLSLALCYNLTLSLSSLPPSTVAPQDRTVVPDRRRVQSINRN